MNFRQLVASRNKPQVRVKRERIVPSPLTMSGVPVTTHKPWQDGRLDRDDNHKGGRHYTLRTLPVPLDVQLPPWARPTGATMSALRPHGNDVVLSSCYDISVPSVTTVLDKMIHSPELDAWREAVGEETANKIAEEAATKGQLVHLLCEQFLNGDSFFDRDEIFGWDDRGDVHPTELLEVNNLDCCNPEAVAIYHMIRGELQEFEAVLASEVQLVELDIGFAGTVDILGRRRGKKVVADIKTYRKLRTESQLEKAFIQMALYAIAARTNFMFETEELVVIYANPTDGLQVEARPLAQFEQQALDLVAAYHMMHTT